MSKTASNREKVVGIIGGMGPAATVDLMQRVIARTPASDDCDHIHMLVDNNPKVPSRVKALIENSGPSPLPTLIGMAQRLQTQGADFLVMPCNTAHHYWQEIAVEVDIPFLNLMELVTAHMTTQQPGLRSVGLLASSALSRIALYESWVEARGAALLYPPDALQAALMELIVAVKSNADEALGYAALQSCADALRDAGADCLLIACTELSVISKKLTAELPVYDAADILADAVIAMAQSPTG